MNVLLDPARSQADDEVFLRRVSAATIRVVILGGWLAWCAQIVLPFLVPILWGGIIAIAAYPLVQHLFPRRASVGAACFGFVALAAIVTPTWMFLASASKFVLRVGKQWSQGELELPVPRADVAEWPLIGPRFYSLWMKAAEAPHSVLDTYLPQLRQVGRWLIQSLGSLTFAVLQSLFAVAIAVAFLAKAQAVERSVLPVLERIAPHRGEHIATLAKATVRAVAKGVLGIAFVQACLAWLGMSFAGVPGAGALALAVLILAVAQIPSGLVLFPVAVYLFASTSKLVAVGFLAWAIVVGVIDNVVKPLVLGRGTGVPMLVIVVGALGGMMSAGVVGLFVGAVVLAVAYELFASWVRNDQDRAE